MSQNPEKDQAYHHGNLRHAMIEASLEIIQTDGIAGLSLRKAAQAVGVSHTAPKNHFVNINGLYTALATQGYLGLSEAMRAGHAPLDRVQVFAGYVHFAVQNPDLFELMFTKRKLDVLDGDFQAAVATCRAVLDDLVLQIVRDAYDETEYERVKIQLWSFVHGLAQLALSGVVSAEKLDLDYVRFLMPDFSSNVGRD